MIKRGIPLILTYHLEGKNHLYLNSLHSMGPLHLREWFDSHQGLWYTLVLSPMLPLCRVESLSTFLGSIPFSVIGHSFNLNISEKLFVRNYQKKMRRARVLRLPKWSPSDKHTTPGGVLQHGTRFSLVGMDNRGTPISGEPSFLHFPGGGKKKQPPPSQLDTTSAILTISASLLYRSSPQATAHHDGILLLPLLPLSSKGWDTRESEPVDKPV